MESIFPGMDPYLEAPGLWQDVHAGCIAAIRDQIQELLVPKYVAAITPYVVFESLEIGSMRVVVPDVSIYERHLPGRPGSSMAVIEPAPLTETVAVSVPTRYARVEVRTVAGGELVTAIELLSPANKRPGAEGYDAYEKKRGQFMLSSAHLLEIDLLRGGTRPSLTTPLPPDPYFIFLSRAERRPVIEIWPIKLQSRLPVVAVPLLPPDLDVALDLGAILHRVYRNARYDVQIDYRQPPPPPDFSREDAAWIDQHLRAKGVR
ncbi:MAG: DUF4058 family protein [Oscillochloris sp.]|nr:DUF4058 family protein [Oscillochloris sp.]